MNLVFNYFIWLSSKHKGTEQIPTKISGDTQLETYLMCMFSGDPAILQRDSASLIH